MDGKESCTGNSEQIEARTNSITLIVDDYEPICRAIARDLRSLGRRAIYTLTAYEAVMLMVDPDINIESVVVDLFLVWEDGLEFLSFVTREYPDVRRVLISAVAPHEKLRLARASGTIHAFISKPWERIDLATALEL